MFCRLEIDFFSIYWRVISNFGSKCSSLPLLLFKNAGRFCFVLFCFVFPGNVKEIVYNISSRRIICDRISLICIYIYIYNISACKNPFMHASKGILNLPTSSLHLCSSFHQNRYVKIHHQFTRFSTTIRSRFTAAKIKLGEDSPS